MDPLGVYYGVLILPPASTYNLLLLGMRERADSMAEQRPQRAERAGRAARWYRRSAERAREAEARHRSHS